MDAVIQIDLHGMSLDEARDALDEALRRADMSVYRIRAIHGFNSGTALRDMIRREYRWHMKVMRISRGQTDGQTDLVLREY
jgi:DNA-nicking Smr family endonuclease